MGTKETPPFLKRLKEKCKNCTAGSIMVYWRNIKRLYRLTHDDDDVPVNSKWLNDALLKKYKKLPLKQRRHLSVAAIKVLQTLGKKTEDSPWRMAMLSDAGQHQAERAQNKRSKKEADTWPKHGIKTSRTLPIG